MPREVIRVDVDSVEHRREQGQGMVEYALILVLVSIVVIIILSLLGGTIQNVFDDIVAAM
jgi:pilus assembly protein Flp/PilA